MGCPFGRAHLDSPHAGIRLGQNESHQRSGDNDEQKYRQDDGLADADDAPVIEEMQFWFPVAPVLLMDPKSKKRGASGKGPAPRQLFSLY